MSKLTHTTIDLVDFDAITNEVTFNATFENTIVLSMTYSFESKNINMNRATRIEEASAAESVYNEMHYIAMCLEEAAIQAFEAVS